MALHSEAALLGSADEPPFPATMPDTTEQAVHDIQAVNTQLLIAGLREQELAEQLQRQLAFTIAITNSLAEGLVALDRAGRFTMVDPAAERMLGWTEGELIGRDMQAVIHDPAATRARIMAADSPLMAVMRSGTAACEEEALWKRRDGSVLPTAYSAAPMSPTAMSSAQSNRRGFFILAAQQH